MRGLALTLTLTCNEVIFESFDSMTATFSRQHNDCKKAVKVAACVDGKRVFALHCAKQSIDVPVIKG